MAWLDFFRGRKAVTVDDIAREIARSRAGASGAVVSTDSSMRVAAVYGCVRVIAETVGSLPLHIYRRTANGKERADTHPLYRLLHDTPNPWQTAMEFREMMQAHLCLRGNAYAFINWIGPSMVGELIPIHPDRVTVRQRPDMSLAYEVRRADGTPTTFEAEDIFHIRGLSSDGFTGRSVLDDARETIGVAISTQEYAGRFYANDATPSLAITLQGKLGPDGRKRFVDSWNETFAGSRNARRTVVLEEGAKVEPIAMTFDDAQFLETRKFQRSEIAGIFRVPPHLIGDLERATYGNIEHQSIEFVTHCIRPWLVRWEQAISKALFTAPGLYYPEHAVEGLLRGDIKSRYDAYAIGRTNGWLSANDIRALENMNPISGGEVYLTPLNMTPATEPDTDLNN
jgi:HK97 family phage portal protein